jgi:hypothetical protein
MFSDQQAIHGVIVPVKTHQTHLAADGYDNGGKTTGIGMSSVESRAMLSLMDFGHVVGKQELGSPLSCLFFLRLPK